MAPFLILVFYSYSNSNFKQNNLITKSSTGN